MDSRFRDLCFASNHISNSFMDLCNSVQTGVAGADNSHCADTTLRLDSPACVNFSFPPRGIKRKWSSIDGPMDQKVEWSLDLCLGQSSSSSESKGSTATRYTSMSSNKETEEESSMDLELDFLLHLGGEKLNGPERSADFKLKSMNMWPSVDLQLRLSSGLSVSDITTVNRNCNVPTNVSKMIAAEVLNADEGSPGSSVCLQNKEHVHPITQSLGGIMSTEISPGLSSSMATPLSSVSCSSRTTHSLQQHSCCTKTCQFQGCLKGARGASGLCIAHGGGRRCQRPGCSRGAEGRTAFCKAHGGGRRCEFLGCTKSAEGRTDFCIAHGGGRRCNHEQCTRAARGKSGLCIRHGGGKRCHWENCTKSAEGLSGLCIGHGGGRRCHYPECGKGAQGSTMFCKAHGGGKRCTYPGCSKGAEGSTPFCKGHGGGKRCSFQGSAVCPKSVHGGTLFCVAHGGGKRCDFPECTKSARGRTNFCVRHGGGKRCKTQGCGKSAQGSTDFCKAHGGGKRCSWGHPGSEFGNGDCPCNSFSRGKSGLCASHSCLIQDQSVHGGASKCTLILDSKTNQTAKIKHTFSADNMSFNVTKMETEMLNPTASWSHFVPSGNPLPTASNPSLCRVPEGRVHGGNLMAVVASSHGFNFSSCRELVGSLQSEKCFSSTQRRH